MLKVEDVKLEKRGPIGNNARKGVGGPGRGRLYTKEEDTKIKIAWDNDVPIKDIANELSRSYRSIVDRKRFLIIK